MSMNPSGQPGRLSVAPPPLERISTMADAREVARFRASAKTPADRIRLGEHMLRRNPDRIRPYLLLAEHAPAPMIRNVYLGQAVSAGHRLWAPWLKGEQTIAWWTDEATQPFMTALAMYGLEMAHNGTTWIATKCLKQLPELDPADNIGAVDLFAEAGLIHPGAEPSPPGRIT